jgi:LPXTG-site transpeptidase (sortase) family protein
MVKEFLLVDNAIAFSNGLCYYSSMKNAYPNHETSFKRKVSVWTAAIVGGVTLTACSAGKSSTPTSRPSALVTTTRTPESTTPTTAPSAGEVAAENLVKLGEQRLGRVTGVQGETGFGIVIPALCDETAGVVSMSSSNVLTSVGDGPSASNIDQIVPDSPAQPDCAATTDHAASMLASNPVYATRGTRTNANYSGTANQFFPVVGLLPNSALPGQPGNVTLFGHRTTESAPFSSIDQLKDGDNILAFNGSTFYDYVVTSEQDIPANDLNAIADYGYNSASQPEGDYMTIFACGPDQRQNSARLVIRLAQANIIANSSDLVG